MVGWLCEQQRSMLARQAAHFSNSSSKPEHAGLQEECRGPLVSLSLLRRLLLYWLWRSLWAVITAFILIILLHFVHASRRKHRHKRNADRDEMYANNKGKRKFIGNSISFKNTLLLYFLFSTFNFYFNKF